MTSTTWRDHAACIGHDPEMFTSASEEEMRTAHTKATNLQRVQQAIRICNSCPVRTQCADYVASITDVPMVGVWAGRYLDQREGQRLKAAAVQRTTLDTPTPVAAA